VEKLLILLINSMHLLRHNTGPPVSVEAEDGGHLLITQGEVKDLERQELQSFLGKVTQWNLDLQPF
jgi:hypothetical protein